MRKTIFAIGEYYHIYNRGVDKREVFLNEKDYERFLLSMNLLNDKNDGLMIKWRDFKKTNPESNLSDFLKLRFRREPLVEIICYCLNPNHYHFILKQLTDDGIEKFMHKIGTSYTKYFNKRNSRNGVLFQGVFKSINIDSNEYLLYLSAYINKNNFIHGYNNEEIWKYSSFPIFLGKTKSNLISKKSILSQFGNIADYKQFVNDNAFYMKKKKELREYLMED